MLDTATEIPAIPTDIPEEFRTLALSWFDLIDSTEKVTEPRTGYRGIDPSILKDYPLPSLEEKRKFKRYNRVACLRSQRIYAWGLASYSQTAFPDDGSHAKSVSKLKAKITVLEKKLRVTWIVDETMGDGGFYRSAEGEDYKKFVGQPGAGGSGSVPCMFDPKLWHDYCGKIPPALLALSRGSSLANAPPSLESA